MDRENMKHLTLPTIFNTPLELGTRCAFILSTIGEKLSIDDLVILDYALLYSSEFNGPKDLHPSIPNHLAEIAHRREHFPEALSFLSKRGIITAHIEDTGHYYSTNDNTIHYISCLKSNYYKKAWHVLMWLKSNYETVLDTSFPKQESLRA